jgi:hypothetical protein
MLPCRWRERDRVRPASGHRGEVVLEVQLAPDGARLIVMGTKGVMHLQGWDWSSAGVDLAYEGEATLRIGGAGDRTVVEVSLPLGGPVAGAAT